MPRSSPVYYIEPSALSVIANANGLPDDVAVTISRFTHVTFYSPAAGIDMSGGTYQWRILKGRNRRLAESSRPYTIYVRMAKATSGNGYLVFAPKVLEGGAWKDKYPYVTQDGISSSGVATATPDVTAAVGQYWFLRLGDVSLPVDGRRTLSVDTGILGTGEYNNQWSVVAAGLATEIGRLSASLAPQRSLARSASQASGTAPQATVVTAYAVAAMTGAVDPFAGDGLLRPVMDLADASPCIIFYASDGQGLPVAGYGGLSAAWDAMAGGDDARATGVPVTLNLPFAAPRTTGGTQQPFLAAMAAVLGSQSAAELAELEARRHIGSSVDLTNMSHEGILVRGLDGLPDDGSSGSAAPDGPWDAFLLPPSARLRATCAVTPSGSVLWRADCLERGLAAYHAATWEALGIT